MTMNGHTVTYDGVEAVDGEGNGTGVGAYRTFLGNMSYSGAGKIVVATNGWIQSHISSPTATDTDVEVYGRYWQNSGNLTPVKSLRFMAGSNFRELNANAVPITVYTTYAPPPNSESEEGYNKRPRVQLGADGHLETTFDLSQLTTTFDDSVEGTLTFYPGTKVTVDVGERTAGFAGYAYLWKEDPTATVSFVRSENMRNRGLWLTVDNKGISIDTGLCIRIK